MDCVGALWFFSFYSMLMISVILLDWFYCNLELNNFEE